MIHSLGMDFVPVDECANRLGQCVDKCLVEPVPNPELASAIRFSTRLFE